MSSLLINRPTVQTPDLDPHRIESHAQCLSAGSPHAAAMELGLYKCAYAQLWRELVRVRSQLVRTLDELAVADARLEAIRDTGEWSDPGPMTSAAYSRLLNS